MTALAVMVLMCCQTEACAQKLRIPQRWETSFRNVLPLYRNDTVRICFIGDVMMHGKQIEQAKKEAGRYDFSSYFTLIKEDLTSADITAANMEFALGGEPYTGYPAFSAPDEIASYAVDCGIDLFLTANNHIFDKGKSGAERTMAIYRDLKRTYGISFTGLASDEVERSGNNPLIMNAKGIRLAFVNFTYGTNGGRREGWPKVNYMDDRQDIAAALDIAKEKGADITIALPHWGNEYELTHSPGQEETAAWLAENGVDFIIGTHPHVVQDTMSIETSAGRTQVVYSLGNAVSNMSAENTQLELMATANIVRHCNGDIEVLPLELTFLWCSRPGGFNDSYTVVPVARYIGRRELWKGAWDYDKMMQTYSRVSQITGITDIHR